MYLMTKEINKDSLEQLADILSAMQLKIPPKQESFARKLFGTQPEVEELLAAECLYFILMIIIYIFAN